ncbi:DUF397 domain-containing protein [Yinghuangia aomiensis]|uniref:DUF397 domain-containing protein n=1 Tax=Yinghuangia aomiensis TaxID=676205 RepID=A0ABP9GRW1_9ACTN
MNRNMLRWVKSSYSGAEGGNCVEIAWRKATYSSEEGGECVEVALTDPSVLVRDSKIAGSPIVPLTSSAWSSFLTLALSPSGK